MNKFYTSNPCFMFTTTGNWSVSSIKPFAPFIIFAVIITFYVAFWIVSLYRENSKRNQ